MDPQDLLSLYFDALDYRAIGNHEIFVEDLASAFRGLGLPERPPPFFFFFFFFGGGGGNLGKMHLEAKG